MIRPATATRLSLATVVLPRVFLLGPFKVERMSARLIAICRLHQHASHVLGMDRQHEAAVGAGLEHGRHEVCAGRRASAPAAGRPAGGDDPGDSAVASRGNWCSSPESGTVPESLTRAGRRPPGGPRVPASSGKPVRRPSLRGPSRFPSPAGRAGGWRGWRDRHQTQWLSPPAPSAAGPSLVPCLGWLSSIPEPRIVQKETDVVERPSTASVYFATGPPGSTRLAFRFVFRFGVKESRVTSPAPAFYRAR